MGFFPFQANYLNKLKRHPIPPAASFSLLIHGQRSCPAPTFVSPAAGSALPTFFAACPSLPTMPHCVGILHQLFPWPLPPTLGPPWPHSAPPFVPACCFTTKPSYAGILHQLFLWPLLPTPGLLWPHSASLTVLPVPGFLSWSSDTGFQKCPICLSLRMMWPQYVYVTVFL